MKKIIISILVLFLLTIGVNGGVIADTLGILTYEDNPICMEGRVNDNLNGIYYIDSVAEFNTQMGSNRVVRVLPGTYGLTVSGLLYSNMTLIVDNGAEIYWETGSTPSTVTDLQNTTFNYMFIGEGIENLKIINNGVFNARKTHNPTYGDHIFFINNSNNIDMRGGSYINTNAASGIFNTNYVVIDNIYIEDTTVTWQECTNYVQLTNFRGKVDSSEGEVIDMNGYSKYVTMSNFNIEANVVANDEIVDINANRHVTLNNIVGKNSYRLITVSDNSGIRFGTCDSFLGENVVGTNMVCDNCSTSPSVTGTNVNVFLDLMEDGVKTIYGINTYEPLKFDDNHILKIVNNHFINDSENVFWIESTHVNSTRPLLRINGASSQGGEGDIRIDSPNPDIEFVETDQTSPDGKFEIAINGNRMQFNSRNGADNSFETAMYMQQLDMGGALGLGINPSPNSGYKLISNGSISIDGKIETSEGLRMTAFGGSVSVVDAPGDLFIEAGFDNGGNENLYLQSNGVGIKINSSGGVKFDSYSGTGNDYACFDSLGNLYRSAVACS